MIVKVATAAALVSVSVQANATLHVGNGHVRLQDGGWDFSDSLFVFSFDVADIHLRVTYGQSSRALDPAALFLTSPAIQLAIDGAPFDSLKTAPDSAYAQVVAALVGRSYFVRTWEGNYAKLQLIAFDGFEYSFRYVYQDDGSTALDTTVATEFVSWGRVKALYLDVP